jgi:hypothetical protein
MAMKAEWQETTRGGFPCKIQFSDGSGHFFIGGLVLKDGAEIPASWSAIGRYASDESEHPYDLMPKKSAWFSWFSAMRKKTNPKNFSA